MRQTLFGMMMQAAIAGTLSAMGMIKLSTGQQLSAAVLYMLVLGVMTVMRRMAQR